MPNLYREVYRSQPKHEAQEQLKGRTHYVDDGTLKYFYSRILSCGIAAWNADKTAGLYFWLIESCAADMHNKSRVYRPVIFDVFGNVISRVDHENAPKTSSVAKTLLRKELAALEPQAEAITLKAYESFKRNQAHDCSRFEEQFKTMKKTA